jgi:hypothetical protein
VERVIFTEKAKNSPDHETFFLKMTKREVKYLLLVLTAIVDNEEELVLKKFGGYEYYLEDKIQGHGDYIYNALIKVSPEFQHLENFIRSEM